MLITIAGMFRGAKGLHMFILFEQASPEVYENSISLRMFGHGKGSKSNGHRICTCLFCRLYKILLRK